MEQQAGSNGEPPRWPPGWYPDPDGGGPARWWDGYAWTAPPPTPMGAVPVGGYRPAPDLADERAAGSRAGVALLVGAAAYTVSVFSQAIVLNRVMANLDAALKTSPTRGTRTAMPVDGTYAMASVVSNLASLAVLVVGVLFLIWFHRALTNAQLIGLPQRRTPAWGVVGFIIPIVNFWFPYQSACDLFPPGHPDRKLVGRWWALWISAQLGAFVLIAASIASVGLGLVVAAVIAALYVLAALAGRTMIQRALAVHAELLTAAPSAPAVGSDPGARESRDLGGLRGAREWGVEPAPRPAPPPKDPWAAGP